MGLNKEMPVNSLKEHLPVTIRSKLLPDLSSRQVLMAIELYRKGLKVPAHLMTPDLTVIPPEKQCVKHLTVPLRKKGGRDNRGRISVRHRGGGFKRRIRILDRVREFERDQRVVRLEHDPNRSAQLALLQEVETGKLSYVLAWAGLKPGQVIAGSRAKETSFLSYGNLVAPGLTLPLSSIPLGTPVHNIELYPGRGGQLVRSAGTKASLVGKDPIPLNGSMEGLKATIKLPSGSMKKVPLSCRATIGQVGNEEWHLREIGSAGRNRRLGWRPTVRGVAMNAVDHPHGGGKGGRSKGKPSQSPWGKICK